MDVYASKNTLRFLAFATDFKLISSKLFSQTLNQILEESMNLKNHSLDLVLETLLSGLPIVVSINNMTYHIILVCNIESSRKH
jgi:hypothetical protein